MSAGEPHPKRFSQDLLNRLANALTPGSSKKPVNPTPPPSEPSVPAFSAPTSPYTMAGELNDAIATPLSPSTWAAASAATPILTATGSTQQFGTELRRVDSTSSIASSLKRKIELSGLSVSEFFKKLGKGVVNIGRSSKDTGGGEASGSHTEDNYFYDYLASRNSNELQTPPPTPPHQKLKQPLLPPNRAGPPHSSGLGHAKLLSMVAEGDEDTSSTDESDAFPLPTSTAGRQRHFHTDLDGTDPTDPDYLAHRIQQLIDTLPPPPPTPHPRPHKPLPPGTPRPSKPWLPLPGKGEKDRGEGGGGGVGLGAKPNTKPPKRDKSGKPIPPDNAVPPELGRRHDDNSNSGRGEGEGGGGGEDEDEESTNALLKFLQSATVMNGGKTNDKPTVWDMLSRLGAPAHWGWDNEPVPPTDGPEDGGGDNARNIFGDTHSVMMYSPLMPGKADIVELAEAVPVYFEEEVSFEEYAAATAAGLSPTTTTTADTTTTTTATKQTSEDGGEVVSGWSAVKTMWPLGAWFGAVQAQEASSSPSPSPTTTTTTDTTTAPEILVTPPSAPLSLPQSPYIGSPRIRLQSPYTSPRQLQSPYLSPQQLHSPSPYMSPQQLQSPSPYMSPRQLQSPYMSPRMLQQDGELPPVEGLVEGEDGKRYRVWSRNAWVPSTEKVSYEVMWWGYRIYLPPPAMKILDDKTLEAQKRAALITSALTWFFNNIPVDMLPLPLQPTVMLFQRLAPYLGYIGTFIAWSWRTVKGYDVGYGVILSATWLLPIALIPGTWYEYSFPKSPAPPEPVPLPPPPPPTSGAPTESVPSSPAPEPAPSVPPTPTPVPVPIEPSPSPEPTPVPLPPPTEGESPIEPPPTVPPAPIPLPPEDEGGGEGLPHAAPPARKTPSSPKLPSSPKTPSSPFPTPGSPLSEDDRDRIGVRHHRDRDRGAERGGRVDKRGWGRFQVTRTFGAGSGNGSGSGQSFVVVPSSSTPGSPFSSMSELGSGSGSATPTTWGTPLSSPLVRSGANVGLDGSVKPGSPLMDELLKSRRVGTVPLPLGSTAEESGLDPSAK